MVLGELQHLTFISWLSNFGVSTIKFIQTDHFNFHYVQKKISGYYDGTQRESLPDSIQLPTWWNASIGVKTIEKLSKKCRRAW